jgi:hypothetical protein
LKSAAIFRSFDRLDWSGPLSRGKEDQGDES